MNSNQRMGLAFIFFGFILIVFCAILIPHLNYDPIVGLLIGLITLLSFILLIVGYYFVSKR
jgi:multisubunit Na+/H+ antiporter MnhB subunit